MKLALLLFPLFLTSNLFIAGAKELEGGHAPTHNACPTPAEAQAKMTVPPGYEVRCFAHEPMVRNPVAMTWDHRGRLWIVEAYEYPEGTPLPVEKRPFGGEAKDSTYHAVPPKCQAKDNPLEHEHDSHPGIPRDRVIILEDADNDGVADKRTVFVEGLDLASAIVCGDDGIYIGQQPHLLHFKDTDGDDHADEWRVCLTGFGRQDTHELLNSFCWGPDGWLYMTHGVFTHSKVRRPGEPENKGFKFDAGIGRCKPLTGEFEVFADGTSNPWGCDYDAAGNFFVSACVIDHMFHMAPGGLYMRQGGAPENPYAYELLPSIVTHQHLRAAYAGVQIYQGGRYPGDTRGHVFIGNIHDNAIHEDKLTPVGASFKSEPVRDFLRANDGWFRPVSIQTGPDGFLWIMDWCDKYPCYQNAKANPGGVDRERGRIWRVVTAGERTSPARYPTRQNRNMDLAGLPTPELMKLLEHPNNWMRRTARRMLVERNDLTPKDINLLWISSTQRLENDDARAMESLWTLENLAHKPGAIFGKPLKPTHKNPMVRAWSARTVGELPDDTGIAELVQLARDPDPQVRAAVATALRQCGGGDLTVNRRAPGKLAGPLRDAFAALIESGGVAEDKTLAFLIWMGLEPYIASEPANALDMLANAAPPRRPLPLTLAYKSMRRICDTREPKNLDLALAFCTKIQTDEALLAQALAGLVKGLEGAALKPAVDVSAQLAAWQASPNVYVRRHALSLAVLWGDDSASTRLLAVLADVKAAPGDVLRALVSLRTVRTDAVRAGLAKLLAEADSRPSPAVMETIRIAAEMGGEAFPSLLVHLASSKDPGIQQAALAALTGRAEWTHAMLTAITAGKLSATGFPIPVRRSLAASPDPSIRDHASQVLGAWKETSDDTTALIATKRKACLDGEPDLAMGKMIFTASCAACHTFHGGGQKVGPDLIGSGRSNLDALLANVIDPNQIVGNGYEAVNVITRDQRTLSGRLIEDTPGHVKLLSIGGAEQVVPRDQIEKLEKSRQSLMPTGFGALPDDSFRNLVWYILAPPEEGPLTREKKAALSTSIDPAPPGKPISIKTPPVDWESVSLWNPHWKVTAPEFEGTPVKLVSYQGRNNVLMLHPFDREKPSSLERGVKLAAGKPHRLTVTVAAHDQGDWELRVYVNGKPVTKQTIGHDGDRWKTVTVDLSESAGQEVNLRLEGAATGWAWEFGYWGEVKVD